jgi:multidrug transporter EmrE-like cation transporter
MQYYTTPTTPPTSGQTEHAQHHYPTTSVLALFILNGLSHFCQNVFAFSILSLVTPVSYSIASLVKRIVVIVASILWFAQPVSSVQMVRYLCSFDIMKGL